MRNLVIQTEDGIDHNFYNDKIKLIYLDGIGLPNVNRILTKAPLEHVMQDKGYIIEPRIITLQVAVYGKDAAEMYSTIDYLTEIFSSTDEKLILKATRDDGIEKWIDCYLNGEVQIGTQDRVNGLQTITIPLICPDPIWYQMPQISLSFPITSTDQTLLFNSDFTWQEHPKIRLTGLLAAGFYFIMQPANMSMVMDDTIPSGETWEIDLTPHNRKITKLSDSSNKTGSLRIGFSSSFSYIVIESKKMVRVLGSDDNIVFHTDSFDANSNFQMLYYKRFVSL